MQFLRKTTSKYPVFSFYRKVISLYGNNAIILTRLSQKLHIENGSNFSMFHIMGCSFILAHLFWKCWFWPKNLVKVECFPLIFIDWNRNKNYTVKPLLRKWAQLTITINWRILRRWAIFTITQVSAKISLKTDKLQQIFRFMLALVRYILKLSL